MVTLAVTIGSRLMLGPLGMADLIAFASSKVVWELQEWAIHAHIFHGENPLKHHENHHNLPYYHVTMEPLNLGVGSMAAVAGIGLAAVNLMGAPATLVVTSVAAINAWGIWYMGLHFLSHSKLPLKGWLQPVRSYHIRHHMDSETNFNMCPYSVDNVMQTKDA